MPRKAPKKSLVAKKKNVLKVKATSRSAGKAAFLKTVKFETEWLWYLLAAWALAIVGLFSLPNFRMLLPVSFPLANIPTGAFIWLGFGAMIFLWRMVPTAQENAFDISPRTARIWFWLLMALGLALRFNQPEQPVGFFWDDHYYVVSDMRNIIDLQERPLLFPFGWREPFYPYLTAFLWLFLPKASGVFMIRLSSTLIEIVTLWMFYLIGKEIGGRRMGLILLGAGAASKEMIMIMKFGYGSCTTVLGCALTFLFFLRVLKKPDWLHFLEWGTALGFGAYTYVPFRIWIPVMLGALWLWVFSDPRERRWNIFRVILGPGLLLAWAFLFLYKNAFLTKENALVGVLVSPLALVVIAAALLFSYFKVFQENKNIKSNKVFGWATGAFTTAFVMLPLFLHPNYSEHVASIFTSFYNSGKSVGGGFLNMLWQHYVTGITWMFGHLGDVGRIPAQGDSLFTVHAAAFGLLGVAYFAARPSWLKAFVLALYLSGLLPFLLTPDPHPFRWQSVVLPILLAGAWGLNRLWITVLQTKQPKLGNLIFTVVLVLFGTWEVCRNSEVIAIWMDQKGPDSIIADQVEKELPDHRVYIRKFTDKFFGPAQDILSDNKDVFRMNDSNPIDLVQGEKGQDLAILVDGNDLDTQAKLKKEFPDAVWHERPIYWQSASEVPFMKWIEVPFAKLTDNKKEMFYTEQVLATNWERRFYGNYGLCRGVILYDAKVAHWNEALPPADTLEFYNSVRLDGIWNTTADKAYTFTIHTGNTLEVWVDAQEVIALGPKEGFKNRSETATIKAGLHQVKVISKFNYEHQVPIVMVKEEGSTAEMPLDELNKK